VTSTETTETVEAPETTAPEPAAPEPAATAPAATEPAATEPAATEPAATEPAATGPDAVEAAPAKPVTRRPISDATAQTVGRRKEAVVRVRLIPGSGQFTLNGKTLEQYFPNKVHQQLIREPLVTTEKAEAYDVIANLKGGGTSGQAGALRLGIARALVDLDAEDRPPLKKAGFLTRDARVKERKKYGLKKARKAPQYSKR